MKAVVRSQLGSASVERLDDPAPPPDGIVVSPDGCGICRTDLHIIDGEFDRTHYPIVPGHEFAGEIVAVGRDVSGLRVGDVVAIEPSAVLRALSLLPHRTGNLYESFDSIGVGHADGGCAELVAVPATQAIVLAEGFPAVGDH
jgi:D-arabinose 1-dehydrogenase-like Zn-dependent alcohol dehydrogenase